MVGDCSPPAALHYNGQLTISGQWFDNLIFQQLVNFAIENWNLKISKRARFVLLIYSFK